MILYSKHTANENIKQMAENVCALKSRIIWLNRKLSAECQLWLCGQHMQK